MLATIHKESNATKQKNNEKEKEKGCG